MRSPRNQRFPALGFSSREDATARVSSLCVMSGRSPSTDEHLVAAAVALDVLAAALGTHSLTGIDRGGSPAAAVGAAALDVAAGVSPAQHRHDNTPELPGEWLSYAERWAELLVAWGLNPALLADVVADCFSTGTDELAALGELIGNGFAASALW